MEIGILKTDLDAAEDGTFFPIADDASIKIAQWNNKNHKAFLRDLYAKHGKRIDAGAISESQASELLAKQWLHIVKDWEGFTDDGEELVFSEFTLLSLVENPQYSNLFARIETISREEENFRIENVKELGND